MLWVLKMPNRRCITDVSNHSSCADEISIVEGIDVMLKNGHCVDVDVFLSVVRAKEWRDLLELLKRMGDHLAVSLAGIAVSGQRRQRIRDRGHLVFGGCCLGCGSGRCGCR